MWPLLQAPLPTPAHLPFASVSPIYRLYQVFELFARHRVKVDLISTSETNLSITIHESVDTQRVGDLLEDLESLGRCSIKHNRAIVSIIGEGMARQVRVVDWHCCVAGHK